MENKMLIRLKNDLKEAIAKKDIAKIEEISKILSISDEQAKYFNNGLTGYPSVDKVWLNCYNNGAYEKANDIPLNKTAWDIIEEKLIEYDYIPVLEYFGRVFSRQEFIDSCYTWARTFRAMGVEENEVVPVYGPVVPDICAMVFALNMIGACPYFLKLAINKKALEEETRDSKIAVVYDGMWQNVAEEFSKDKFKNVIVVTVPADMPSPKKQIVSFLSTMKSIKSKSKIPNEKKYIWADKARNIGNYYSGNVKVPFKSNRPILITSSSGTTVGGVVKGIVATNESVISQLYYENFSEIPYLTGDRVLNHFPFTASTSLNSLFMYPIFKGMTVVLDPRVSTKDFYNQLTTLRPSIALTTGSSWECFFNRVAEEMKNGKKFDFSYAKGWSVGGEGTDVSKFEKWNEIMNQAGAYNPLFSGYGLSEAFAGVSVDNPKAPTDPKKQIISVGIPEAGMTVGVFDEDGNELSYNQRGELWVKSKTTMKEYYKKEELTKQTIKDGWIKTGDLAEIDDKGLIYVWGRLNDTITTGNDKVYFFDIANIIKSNDFIMDAIVLSKPTDENENNLVAHIVWSDTAIMDDKKSYIETMNEQLKEFLPNGIEVSAFFEYQGMLPYSSTTLKKDKNKMFNQNTGFIQVIDGQVNNIEFVLNENGKYSQKCAIITNDRVKTLARK